MTAAAPDDLNQRLLADGSLSLSISPDAAPLAAPWLPLGLAPGVIAPSASVLRVEVATSEAVLPSGPPTLALQDVRCWVDGDRVELRDRSPAAGTIDLTRRRATITLSPLGPDATEPLLTVSAALLLGRAGKALLHAAATVAPNGGAWLLVGDSHTGKSTTTATLTLGGWGYLSDDQVVVGRRGESLHAEGWRRSFNLDAGWEEGRVTGQRVVEEGVGAGRERREAPVTGILLPRVDAERPTALAPVTGADAFQALVRQSPWLLADRAAAPAVVSLLEQVARLPAWRLSLGRDCYRDPKRLIGALAPLGR